MPLIESDLIVGVDDLGHDVKFFGATSSRFLQWDESEDYLLFRDNVKGVFGNGADLKLYHDASNSYIENGTGNLYIMARATDADMSFQCDDGSGGDAEYFRLDGGAVENIFSKDVRIIDSEKLMIGSGQDTYIYHNGSNTFVDNYTGDLYFRQEAADKDIIFQCDDGSGGVATYFYLDGSEHDGTFAWTKFPDSSMISMGNSNDLIIGHNATNSSMINYNGDLEIKNAADDGDIIFTCDDGSGGTETYFFLDGSASSGNPVTIFPDSSGLYFGTGADCMLRHDGTDMTFENNAGDLVISCATNDKDIILKSDDGSGGTATYIQLDGSTTTVKIDQNTRVLDSKYLALGSGSDLQLSHDGSHSYMIQNGVGNLYIRQSVADADLILSCDDGSGGDAAYITLDGSSGYTKAHKHILYEDDAKAMFGTGGDMQILHDGSNSYISQNVTGALYIENNATDGDVILRSDDGSGGTAEYFRLDGGLGYTVVSKLINFSDNVSASWGAAGDLSIRHDGTDNLIAGSNGHIYITNSADDKDIILRSDDGSGGVETYFYLDGSNNFSQSLKHIRFADNASVLVGSSSDLSITHDGTNSVIANSTGNLQINQNVDDGDLILQCDDGSGGTTAYITLDGSAARTVFSQHTEHGDSKKAFFGNSLDLSIYHDASHSYIQANGTGDLIISQDTVDQDIIFKSDNGAGGSTTYFRLDGSAAAHDGSATTALYTNWPDNSRISLGASNDLMMYHNGTHSWIWNDVGHLYINNAQNDGDVILRSDDGSGGLAAYLTLDGGVVNTYVHKDMRFEDSVKVILGTGGDVNLYHDGSNMTMINSTGSMAFYQAVDDGDMVFYCDDGSGGNTAYLTLDGGITSILAYKDILMANDGANGKIKFGASQDLEIYHDGTDNQIVSKTGDLVITNTAHGEQIYFKAENGSGTLATYLTINGSSEKTIFNKPSQRTFEKSSTTDGDANGDIVYFGGTTSMTTGAIYHYKSDGTWELADADAAANCDGLLGVALGAASDTNGMLLRGMVTLDHDPGAVGDVLFLSTTAGDCSATAPSGNGDIVRVIGYCIDASNGQIWFNPDGTFVEVTA